MLKDGAAVGQRVAIIGAGGIGFDTAEFLSHHGESSSLNPQQFYDEWGIDNKYQRAGGLKSAKKQASTREIFLLQRKAKSVGSGLGKTTGWIHRSGLKQRHVHMLNAVQYDHIDDQGLHITVNEQQILLDVDHIVICAGQESYTPLYSELSQLGQQAHLIGGAKLAGELDAKRAIAEGAYLAATL